MIATDDLDPLEDRVGPLDRDVVPVVLASVIIIPFVRTGSEYTATAARPSTSSESTRSRMLLPR